MSNFIIRQQGPSSVVADNLWEIRPSLGSLLVGALAMVAIGRYLGKRHPGAGARTPQGWPVDGIMTDRPDILTRVLRGK